MSEVNPRYAAYARAHGRSADEMLAFDRERYPGGCMAEFIVWIGRRWSEWRKINGLPRNPILSSEDYANFDAWLADLTIEQIQATIEP